MSKTDTSEKGLEALIDAGLAESERDGVREGFSFAHAMLREAILDRARSSGRLAAHHRICARMLALRPHAAVERVARHLAAGERHLAALEPLGTAIEIALEEGDAHGAGDLLELRAAALDAAQVAQDDTRRAEDWLRAARVAFLRSNFEQMTTLVHRADAASESRRQATVEHVRGVFERLAKHNNAKMHPLDFGTYWDHPGGGCRMGSDPATSVTDSYGKTHDHENLFVVGAPTVPTAGCTNGTLTFSALTLRSADHIAEALGGARTEAAK